MKTLDELISSGVCFLGRGEYVLCSVRLS